MSFKLDGKSFKAIDNSKNGTINGSTIMTFTSGNEVILGEYKGGTVIAGQVLAKWTSGSTLNMLYQGATDSGDIQAGKADAKFETLADGKLKMSLDWRWLTGDLSKGESQWLEV